jgi:hypothetical protein
MSARYSPPFMIYNFVCVCHLRTLCNFYSSYCPYFDQDEYYVGFQVLTVVVMKNSVFWNVTLVSVLTFSSTLKMEAI